MGGMWSESTRSSRVVSLGAAVMLALMTVALTGLTSPGMAGASSYPNGVDMNRIAYVNPDDGGLIGLVNADGTDSTAVEVYPQGPDSSQVAYPQLSPDGSTVLFETLPSVSPTTGCFDEGIAFINVDGTDLTNVPTPPGAGCVQTPALSPDGSKVAYQAMGTASSGSEPGIWVQSLDGSDAVRLTATGTDPTWSPDGKEIVFAQNGQIFTMSSSTGGGVHQWTTSASLGISNAAGVDAELPEWSPNGLYIEFQAVTQARIQSSTVEVINVLTGGVSELVGPLVYLGSALTWAPDSAHLVAAGTPAQGSMQVLSLQGHVTSTTGDINGEDPSWIHVQGTPGLGSPIVGLSSTPSGSGYQMVSADGGILSYGQSTFYGSTGGLVLNKPIVGMASTPNGQGYWLVASDGGIFSFGDAQFYGSTGGLVLNKPIVGMASTPNGQGYWLVASDGGIFSFGDAQFYGSTGGLVLNKPIVGMASTPNGQGYWLVASDGGIFSFGDAQFYGSTGGLVLNKPIVGMASTPNGQGYWLVASDGGIFSFGDAQFYGSTGGLVLNKPIVGMASTPNGQGYWLVASDGGIFSFGDAQFYGSKA